MSRRVILSSGYLPPLSYFAALLRALSSAAEGVDGVDGIEGAEGGSVVVDLGEHYLKRSLRNRCRIMTAQGVMDLTVPVCGANRLRQPMAGVQIDNSKRWQHQHWIAICSAYRSSPYFEHYEHLFEPLYVGREHSSLVEFNRALLDVVLGLLPLGVGSLGSAERIIYSDTYVDAAAEDLDLRAKGAVEDHGMACALQPYIQVFEDRQPFVANLSILDLLFCEGPAALEHLL